MITSTIMYFSSSVFVNEHNKINKYKTNEDLTKCEKGTG